MCGLVGVINKCYGEEVLSKKLEEKISMMRHRGPDNYSVVTTPGWALAHTRLSINDLSESGNQPFIRDGISLICNGEIYNHQELRKLVPDYQFQGDSDNEVIIPLYQLFGDRFVEMLDGEFAFILMDSDRIFAARDPLGVKPLFICEEDGAIWLSSEKHVLASFGKEICALEPGCYWLLEEGSVRYYKPSWWDFSSPVSYSKSPVDYDSLRSLVVSSVTKRLMSDVPVGCMLSGGLDSSIVAAIAAKNYSGRLKTFTVGFESVEKSIDLHYARMVAEYLGTDHHEIIVSEEELLDAVRELERLGVCDEVVMDTAPQYVLYKYASKHVKVILVGEGADEVFNGYSVNSRFSLSRGLIQEETCFFLLWLSNVPLLRADHASMRHSVEARVPFLDKDLVDYVMQLDPLVKSSGGFRSEKYILRKAFEDYLPKEVVWRKKLPGMLGYSDGYLNFYMNLMEKQKKLREVGDRSYDSLGGGLNGESKDNTIHPMRKIFDQVNNDKSYFPQFIFKETSERIARRGVSRKKILVTPNHDCLLFIKNELLEPLSEDGGVVVTNELIDVFDGEGVDISEMEVGKRHSVDKFLSCIRLIVWEADRKDPRYWELCMGGQEVEKV